LVPIGELAVGAGLETKGLLGRGDGGLREGGRCDQQEQQSGKFLHKLLRTWLESLL
jgi:hypothetical protein